MIKIKKNPIKQFFGFGVLEVVVAAGIITMGMIGIISLVIQSSQIFYINKSKFTAIMLSQEGVELVRNIRDSNWRKSIDWKQGDGGINTNIEGDGSYRIESNAGAIAVTDIDSILPALPIDDPLARLKLEDGKYIHDTLTGVNTPFFRIIETTVSDLNGDGIDDQLEVVSKVKWADRGNTHTYETKVFFYDWK